jgi:hypothetical protein
LVDLERPEGLQTIKQEGVIGSVRWPLCNQSTNVAIATISYIIMMIMMIMIHDGMVIDVCPSVTLDDGTFLIYDIRVRPVGAPAFKASMGKKVYPLYPWTL